MLELPDDFTINVDGQVCSADVLLPLPDSLNDLCTRLATYYIDDNDGAYTITGNANSGYIISDLTVGDHSIVYVGQDCCGNETPVTMVVSVKDQKVPYAIAEEFIAVPMTVSSSGEVFAKVTAESGNAMPPVFPLT